MMQLCFQMVSQKRAAASMSEHKVEVGAASAMTRPVAESASSFLGVMHEAPICTSPY